MIKEEVIQPMIESSKIETPEIKQIDNISNKVDIYLIGVKSKKQLNDKNIYNSENKFLGERYFATFPNEILNIMHYELNKYIEMT